MNPDLDSKFMIALPQQLTKPCIEQTIFDWALGRL
jgi:hypothetical protein